MSPSASSVRLVRHGPTQENRSMAKTIDWYYHRKG
jgi:hypothetical protein